MNSENRTVNRIFNHKTVSASDIGKIDSVFQGRNMILYPAHECRYIIEFDSFGFSVENEYVHKTSIIGKLSKLNDDFDDELKMNRIGARIYYNTGIMELLFEYNDNKYNFILPQMYPLEAPDDFDINDTKNVYSIIPKSFCKKFNPKVDNWTDKMTLKEVVDKYHSFKLKAVNLQKIRFLKIFLKNLKIKSIQQDEMQSIQYIDFPEDLKDLILSFI